MSGSPDDFEEFSPEWFDACSKAWLANKKRCGASYSYKCIQPKCKNKLWSDTSDLCKFHALKEREERLAAATATQSVVRRSPRLAEQEKGTAPPN